MLLKKERELVVEYGKKMSAAGLSKGTSGNISIYNAEEKLMAISPSGVGYFETVPEDVVVMDLEGNVVEGDKKPSSEWGLHTVFYVNKPDAGQSYIHILLIVQRLHVLICRLRHCIMSSEVQEQQRYRAHHTVHSELQSLRRQQSKPAEREKLFYLQITGF